MTLTRAESYSLERRLAAFVLSRDVLHDVERALLLLSGGADSMALLHLMPVVERRLGLRLQYAALHVDYRARGADSDRDRAFVEEACARAGVPLRVVRLDRPLASADFQARARALRYAAAHAFAAEQGCDLLVTAHNRDDQAETVLYRMTKYASPRGLVGMRPRETRLARPLLCLGAAEIRAYCAARGIVFGEDVTNRDPRYARNLIRLEVLPRLQQINPRVVETLAASAELAAAETDVLTDAARAVLEGAQREPSADDLAALAIEVLRRQRPALRALVLHEWLRGHLGADALVERRPIEALLGLLERADDSGRASLGRGLEAVRGGGLLRLRPRHVPHVCPDLVLDGADVARAGQGGGTVATFCGRRLAVRLVRDPSCPADAAHAAIGLPAVPRALTLRHPRQGERFAPYGLKAETTVARYLASARAPVELRPRALVLDVDGSAAWVGFAEPGACLRGRVAQDYRVHESTPWTLCVFEEEA